MQFVSTVSSFLHFMIRHNVDFCKNEPRFMSIIIFYLNCFLLLMMKMNKKCFFNFIHPLYSVFFIFVKNPGATPTF